jgi:site-specific recombinase XerD
MNEKIPEVTDQEWVEVNEWNRKITEEFLEQGHLSPQTLKQYESALKIFFRWVKDNINNKPLYELRPKDALRYQNFLINRNLSSSGVKFKRSAVSSLCGYIELYYLDDFPTFRNIYNKKIPNPGKSFINEKNPLTNEEYILLIKALEKEERWQLLAYLKFSYASACRRAETIIKRNS